MNRRSDVIRASEIGQYAYCARGWWLGQVHGYRSSNLAAMQRGTARHQVHGRSVVAFHRLRRLAVLLVLIAGAILIAWLLLTLGR